MRLGKGDIRSQRARRRRRYRGCPVCGIRGVQCVECGHGAELVALHGPAELTLTVDGSFVPFLQDVDGPSRDNSDHCLRDNGGHGGAGLVLARGAEILATRACGFHASSSSDAEYQAVIRGARWAPDVPIYTDARELPSKMVLVNPGLNVRYLGPGKRHAPYMLAHRLSIEGRCRGAPMTTPRLGVEFAAERPKRSKAERRQMAAELLLEQVLHDASFQGDFTIVAAKLGWTSGPRWRDNPAIRIAKQLWLERHGCTGSSSD